MKYIRSSFICASLICLALTACGFEPMAGQSTKAYEGQALPSALASVNIIANGPDEMRMIAQDFRIALEDLINPGGNNSNGSDYRLEVSLAPTTQPGLIAPDGKAQRYIVRLDSSFSLSRNSDGKVIENGKLSRSSSYSNQPNSYFSTYIAEQDTIKRLNKELAEQYRMKLASLLTSPPSKPSKAPTIEKYTPYQRNEQPAGIPITQPF